MSDETLERALNFMRDKAKDLADAKANRVYLEQFRKSKKAILFQEAPGGTIADRENYAYSHPDYLALLEGLKEAVEVEELLKYQMRAAELKISVWQSEAALKRAEARSYAN